MIPVVTLIIADIQKPPCFPPRESKAYNNSIGAIIAMEHWATKKSMFSKFDQHPLRIHNDIAIGKYRVS